MPCGDLINNFYSVFRLQQLLTCFSWTTPISLGERYGYNVRLSNLGYNYITGGGGMILSLPAVKLIAGSGECLCPNPSTPDDMFLGICLSRLGIPIVHSPMFHQVRRKLSYYSNNHCLDEIFITTTKVYLLNF